MYLQGKHVSYYTEEEFEDTKETIIIRISKQYRQHNGQKKDNQRSAKHTHQAKDRVTRTLLKTGDELRCNRRSCGVVHF